MLAMTGHDLAFLSRGWVRPTAPLYCGLACVADEESLQFKAAYMLGYEAGLRVHIEPEGCHPAWNAVKCSIRRAGKQIAFLKSLICFGCLHGPFNSGKNQQSFQEAAENFANNLAFDEFQELKELMIADGATEVKAKTWFGSIDALDWLCGNWSLLSAIMDHLVALDDGEPVEEHDSDDAEDEAEAEEPADDQPAAAPAEPKTKGELLVQLKSEHKNTMRLVAALLHDRDLRVELKQIQLGSGPLHAEYRAFLKNQTEGQDASLTWAADRSTGHGWYRCVLDTLALIHDPVTLAACEVTAAPGPVRLPDSSFLEAQEWFRDEQKNLDELWLYLLEVASKRAWGQIQHAALFPQLVAGALSDDKRAAAAAMSAGERLWDAILRAEDMQFHGAGIEGISAAARVSLGRIMSDLAFNRQSFARECAVVCRQAQWQHDYKDVQDLARSLYAKPLNTKFDLEDCFAHLSSVHQLTSKASPFNKWTRYFYATSMPSIMNNNPEYHWPQLETTLRDHAAMKRESAEGKKEAYGKAFKVSEPLDPSVRRNGFVKCKLSSTKKAGIISNQKASCAAAWLAANRENDFAEAGQAWTGCFFVAGHLYQNSNTNQVALCLGFREYGALAVVLKEVKAGDKEFYVIESTPNPADSLLLPSWLFNNTVSEESQWKHVPMKLMHPLLLPADIRDQHTVAMARDGPNEGLVKSALRSGVTLNLQMYRSLHACFGFDLPAKGKGSGKKSGNVIKVDFVRAAVNFFMKDFSDDERQELVDKLMGKRLRHLRTACPQEVMDAFNALPTDDQQAIGTVKFLKKDQSAINHRSKLREPRSLNARVHFTPEDLKDLVPDVPGCYINRHPVLKRYQAFYPVNSFSAALCLSSIIDVLRTYDSLRQ
ncbi:unnamed protein product [Symbiodinium sp. KB8]|nr:unnamed protein product [Symbiodinium sp. KB8]